MIRKEAVGAWIRSAALAMCLLASCGAPAHAAAPTVKIAVDSQKAPAVVSTLDAAQAMQNGRRLAGEGKYDQAALEFMRVFSEKPEHPFAPNAVVEAAQAMLSAGRMSDAARLFETATDRYPDQDIVISSQTMLAAVYDALGEPEKGIAPLKFQQKHGKPQDVANADKKLVELYFRLGRKYEGETLAEKRLKENPGDTQFLSALAESQKKSGDYEPATAIYKKLMAAQPDNISFEREYYDLLKEAGKLDAEIAAMEDKSRRAPDDVDMLQRLKRVYLQQGRSLDALVTLEKIVEKQPGNLFDAVELARQYYANQWKTKAVDTLKKVLERNPEYEGAWRELGNIYLAENTMDEAMKAWKRAAVFNPRDENSYRRMGNYLLPKYLYAEMTALYESGRRELGNPNVFAYDLANLYTQQMMYEKALREYAALAETQPGDMGISSLLIDVATKSGMEDIAPKLMDELIEKGYRSWTIMIARAHVGLNGGDEEGAMRKVSEYAAKSGRAGEFLIQLAGMRTAAGRHAQAAKLFEAAGVVSAVDRPYCLLSAGRSWLSAGDREAGLRDLQKLLNDSPGAPGADEAMALIAQTREDEENYADARYWHSRLAASYPGSAWRDDSMVREAKCAFQSGDFEGAAALYEKLSGSSAARGRMDEILYYSAMSRLYSFHFDEASKGFAKIVDQYPDSRWVNDALERTLFLEDAKETDGIRTQAIISAEKEYIKGDVSSAESVLAGLLMTLPDCNMKGHAALRLAAIRDAAGNAPGAQEALASVRGESFSSELRARALFRAGEIYLKAGDRSASLAKLQELMGGYPDSFWSGRARQLAVTIGDAP